MVHGLYVEVEPIILDYVRKGIHVFYFCGGRGIGKTFSAIDFMRKLGTNQILLSNDDATNKFLYLRRSAVEAQLIADPESTPFKDYNIQEGYTITGEFNAKLGFGTIFETAEKENVIGYAAALSTFANLRGVGFADVSFILYDECIPQDKNKHPLKQEGRVFLNMLETVNRNRIILGLPEVVVCLLSNPIDLASELLSGLRLTPILNTMIFKNQQKFTSYERSLHIEKYKNHKVSEMKRESFLYKFAKDTGFDEESLSGDFVNNDLYLIKKIDYKEYKPWITLENVCVYQHKSKPIYYISQTCAPSEFTFTVEEREKFRSLFYWKYKLLVVENVVFYDSYSTKVVFESMIRFKPL